MFNVTRLAAGLIGRNDLDDNQMRGIVINTAGIEGIKGTVGQIAMSATSGAIIGTKYTHKFPKFCLYPSKFVYI